MEHRILFVEKNSIAEEMGIEQGDVLLSVNDQEIQDVFDFRTLTLDQAPVLLIRKQNGEEWELEIEKEPEEDLGIHFENDLMSDYHRCSNACIFCFIDQMPPGMRETLYFKDDDSRLSFLQGNYITLTNMKEEEIRRIIRYRLEPMNISVHTTDPDLRCRMLKNRFAGDCLRYLDMFYEADLKMNGQIVLCKGWNDKDALRKTLEDLLKYAPVMESVSVVPVGLTKYRQGLEPLEAFTEQDACETIDIIEEVQKKAFQKFGLHFAHASDEFYILARRPFPEEDRYDGYLQLENGVGMARSLLNDAGTSLETFKRQGPRRKYTFATGVLAKPILEQVKEMTDRKFPGRDNRILAIPNHFFGETVTVAGLVTGQDLIQELKDRELGDALLLPNCMFRSGEEVFLDDLTRSDVQKALKVPVLILKNDAEALVAALCGRLKKKHLDLTHGRYELPEL